MSSEATSGPTREKRRLRLGWNNLSYTSRVTLAFAAIAAMTALVAIGVVSFVWEQHFQTYTTENMETLAKRTADRISANCETEAQALLPPPAEGEEGAEQPTVELTQAQVNDILRSASQGPANSALAATPGIGIQVVNNESNAQVLFDSSWAIDDAEGGSTGKSLAPLNTAFASDSIQLGNQVIGSVRIWVLGSDTLNAPA